MAKSKQQKQSTVSDFKDKANRAKSLVFANFEGLSVNQMEDLRQNAREQGGEVMVAKKTLMKRALKDVGIDVDPKTFDKGVATIFGYEDEIAPAKVSAEFAKNNEALNIIGGIVERNYLDAAQIKALSKIPSRQELLGKLVGTIQAPISGLVNVLQGNIRGLVNVLGAIKDNK
ncbi:MAG: 50S ribosomal protein L10 [Candidatus Buchananbacteria bacterium CG10_big_fil_rev_8_21_14_0_10_42_9]|uniref:Large ribosomal subunit protein uL10 n=1 Tax=Candidatus Buchananbacteria bacterium CG10_big_fil_rev_8_21_14_0_10_42_9 TaxID=1974526 RepID=A0A2H0VZV4_9BACT|nr:MAG: 50S ribosomal protein L10 [Candidatus Buchananbacteria bacterium CG10_big_fil_rev_8_21_14_0_10_42_9]